MKLEQRLAPIKLILCDVDGVLTDGKLYYGPQGEVMKVFNVRDGVGIKVMLIVVFVGNSCSMLKFRQFSTGGQLLNLYTIETQCGHTQSIQSEPNK